MLKLLLILGIIYSSSYNIYEGTKIKNTVHLNTHHSNHYFLDACEYDWDCDLPDRCCKGIVRNFCCNIGGNIEKKKKMPKLPNITWPKIPIPIPQPQPQPIPIPIPIPIR